ncbi:hypothetical protein AWH48_17085 [Domibacillus aminovorans]|uniref:HipA-like C-terminal domain-containing protein n=1 Tax=Domibacillus aminovorans TaxID=29332 RepID=A0A177L044_9BACI|nr:HipA domain-containing protein [Domibacillus aminovorans]OAH58704.1 hypothetical protein AWH48_17085 [Domibacillus aminovorans]
MERIFIPEDANEIKSTSSKGDQSKWLIDNKWIKQNTRGYEHLAEYVTSLILECSTLTSEEYVSYTPCLLAFPDGHESIGCYSNDFRGLQKQEVSLERLFESNFESTSDIFDNKNYSTVDKFQALTEKIHVFTGLDTRKALARMLAFDAFILNEDRHTNNILFLYHTKENTWQLAPMFDHGLSLLSDVKDYPMNVDVRILKRKVKAKPFNRAFNKQLSLYQKEPFIDIDELRQKLTSSPYDLGRAKEVLDMQLEDPVFQKLLIEGEK